MVRNILTLTGAALLAGGLAAGPVSAQCDPYSSGCDGGAAPVGAGATTNVGGGGGTAGQADDEGVLTSQGNGATLPFTGSELILLSLVGAGGIAGGTALVLAGRRRTATPAV